MLTVSMLYFYRTMFSQPGYACPHNKRYYIVLCFPCLQDLARLKIALNILAHVPKSLLDPGLESVWNVICIIKWGGYKYYNEENRQGCIVKAS